MLTLSFVIKTMKRYANNISVSDENFFRDFFAYFVDEFSIKNKNGEDYYFAKSTISGILNQKEDVPTVIREAITNYSAPSRVFSAMSAFIDDQLNPSRIDALCSEFKEAINADPLFAANAKIEILGLDNNACIARVFIEAVKLSNIPIRGTKVLWRQGENSLNLITGDIIKLAFGEGEVTGKKIVVIPVNTTFETKLSSNPEDDIYPLVSENTIHGKWLLNILKDISKEDLDARIETYLKRANVLPVGTCNCPGGKSVQYAIGDTVVIQHNNTLFYLVAISEFDARNKAHSSRELIEKSIVRLLEYYDDIGQGYQLYLPLLGTGKSRANLSPKQSYEIIKDIVLSDQQSINGKINIVVLDQMAHEIT